MRVKISVYFAFRYFQRSDRADKAIFFEIYALYLFCALKVTNNAGKFRIHFRYGTLHNFPFGVRHGKHNVINIVFFRKICVMPIDKRIKMH